LSSAGISGSIMVKDRGFRCNTQGGSSWETKAEKKDKDHKQKELKHAQELKDKQNKQPKSGSKGIPEGRFCGLTFPDLSERHCAP
jgi:hypothetical protein